MKKYPEYKGLNLPNIATEVLADWKRTEIFKKSIETREGNKPFVFLKGHLQQMECPESIMLWQER